QGVRVVFRFPFRRPVGFRAPTVADAGPRTVEEQVWRCLLSLPGPGGPVAVLAELEQDQVTFDWELLADTLGVPLSAVFEAASSLFEKHIGRPLAMAEESLSSARQPGTLGPTSGAASSSGAGSGPEETDDPGEPEGLAENLAGSLDSPAGSADLGRAGLRSVESLGMMAPDEPQSPAVELSSATPRAGNSGEQIDVGSSHERRAVEPLLASRVRSGGQQRSDPADSGAAAAAAAAHLDMRQSMLADAMGSRMLPGRQPAPAATAATTTVTVAAEPRGATKPRPPSSSSSFSDLSNSSLTESAMQDALISEAMNASTMSSLLGSRVFPWSKKR
ncbi:hypothetical protein IWQ56_004489, partial [Coemansia nantahalensis]